MLSKALRYLTRHHIAFLALFIALGGTSYAVTALPRNSVGSKQLRANAVTSSKVKNKSLLRKDFKDNELPAGPRGATGATGATGAKGDKGDPGPTASAFASASPGTALNPSPTVVQTVEITTAFSGRIAATGAVQVSADGGNNDEGYCFVDIQQGAGTPADLGKRLSFGVPAVQTNKAAVTVIGAAVRPAGTYTVNLKCGVNGGAVTVDDADLAVIAAAS